MYPNEPSPVPDAFSDHDDGQLEDVASGRHPESGSDEPVCRKDLRHDLPDDVSTTEHASTEGTENDVAPGPAGAEETRPPRHTAWEIETRAERRESSDPAHPVPTHPDAGFETARGPAEEDGRQDGGARTGTGPREGVESGPEAQQDRRALRRLVDLKYLSTQQLHDAVFRGTDLSLVRRWMRRLRANGWVTLWSPPARTGSAPQYASPTMKALRWALGEKLRTSAGTALEALARSTIPRVDRRPVRRNADGLPPFFAHQRGVNDMLIAFDRPTVDTLWSTSWDRPLPKLGAFTPPQPDALLLVRHRSGALHLLFIEHDRDTEKAPVFARDKRGYARMALTPELVRRTFGVDSFQVLVTIESSRADRRIAELQAATRTARYPDGLIAFYDAAVVRASTVARAA